MDLNAILNGATNVPEGTMADLETTADSLTAALGGAIQFTAVTLLIAVGIVVVLGLIRAILVGALARSKGYSFFGNFVLGLFFGLFALIYEAGRPISYERECVMQDRLSMQTAKELYKLQRAREKSQSAPAVPQPKRVID